MTDPHRSYPLDDWPTDDAPPDGPLAVRDLTSRPRLGLRGPGVKEWCAAQGLPFPDRVNAVSGGAGLRVARLGRAEIVILAGPGGRLPPRPERGSGVHDAMRDEGWGWLRIDGSAAESVLSQLCAADLRASAVAGGAILQTRLAGLDAVLLPPAAGDGGGWELLTDIAALPYLLARLRDACPALVLLRGGAFFAVDDRPIGSSAFPKIPRKEG